MGDGPQEIELKLRFDDEAAHQRIRERLDPKGAAPTVVQTNHFIDTQDRKLRQCGIGWRVRHEAGDGDERWVLTLKGPPIAREAPRADSDPSVLSVRLEQEQRIEEADARAMVTAPSVAALGVLLGEGVLIDRVMAALGDDAPSTVGSFTNERVPLPVELGGFSGVIELDRTVFPGEVVHHELELEVTGAFVERAAEFEAELRKIIEDAGATASASRGKASRFFEALAGRPI
jgi:uncharacterized protein YjbK